MASYIRGGARVPGIVTPETHGMPDPLAMRYEIGTSLQLCSTDTVSQHADKGEDLGSSSGFLSSEGLPSFLVFG